VTLQRHSDVPPTALHVFSGDLWAGAEVMIYHLLSEMVKDTRVRTLALSMNDGVLTRRLRDEKVETYVLPEHRYSFASIIVKAVRLFGGRNIDVIHSHRYKENLLSFILAKLLHSKKLIATIHGLPESPAALNRPRRLFSRMEFAALRHCFTQVVAVSQEMKNALVQTYGFSANQVATIYNGIPISYCTYAPMRPARDRTSDTPPHIGTVGRLVPVKDYDLFLRIASETCSREPKAHFSILGDGPVRQHLERRIRELGLERNVTLAPFSEDTLSYYRSLDIYLNTSHHEGIPMSLLEAMACEIPIVAPKVGGLPEMVLHRVNGYLVEGREPYSYAVRCLELLHDPEIRKTMGRASAARVKTFFSSRQMEDRYVSLYFNS